MSPSVSAISSFESQLLAQANVQEANSGNGFSCSHGSTWTAVSDVAVTINGGHTWTPEPLPSNVPHPQLMGVACSSAPVCWVTGPEEVPQTVGTGHDQGSSVLIGTTDGGATWERVTFTTPATAPDPTGQSYLSIAFISCPSASVCVAGGATAAGASTAPLYRLVIPES